MNGKAQHKRELITYDAAASMLGVKPRTLQLRILQEGLTRYRNPVDRRQYFLDRKEVEELTRFEVVMPRHRAA